MDLGDHRNVPATPGDWELRFTRLVRRLFRLRPWVWLSLVGFGAFLYAWTCNSAHYLRANDCAKSREVLSESVMIRCQQ